MTLADLFQRPEAWPLLLLAPLAWIAFALLDQRRRKKVERWLGPRAEELVAGPSAQRRQTRRALFALGLFFAALAAMGPLVGEAESEQEWSGVDLVVALDVSRSMLAGDVPPNRLTQAKQQVGALAARAEGDRLGLVVFAGEARLQVPLTADRRSFAALVGLADPSTVKRGGTDLGAALETSLQALESGEEAPRAVLLLTDGEDLEGRGLLVAKRLAALGIAVHTVGLGTTLGAKIAIGTETGETYLRDRAGREVVSTMDAGGLRRIAETTGGTFVDASTKDQSLVALYERRIVPLARKTYASKEHVRRENRFQWPLALALLCWLIDVGLGDRRGKTARARQPAGSSLASAALLLLALVIGGCDSTSEGRRAFEEGRADDAYRIFTDAIEAAGDEASPELLHDQTIAALATSRYDEAERAGAKAKTRGGPAFAELDAFVRGNRALALSIAAAADAAKRPDDKRALLPAIQLAEDAVASWQWAAASRASWPEARHNVERGLIWLEALRERKSGEGPKRGPKPPRPPPPPPPAPPEGVDEPEAIPRPKLETTDLSEKEVLSLLELLVRREQQKRALRRAERHARASAVERDW